MYIHQQLKEFCDFNEINICKFARIVFKGLGSEAIRVAIRDLIKTEYLIEESVSRNIAPSLIESEVENEIQENLVI
jgi:hypothetical protein